MGSGGEKQLKGGKGPVMDPVTLRFADRQLEGRFRSSWHSATRSLGFWWRAGSTVYYVLFSLLLAVYDPSYSETLNTIHLVVLLPIALVTIFGPMRFPSLERHCNPAFLCLLTLIFLIECLQVRAAEVPVAYLYLFNATVIMVFAQQFPSNRLTGTILLSLLYALISSLCFYGFGGSAVSQEIPMLPLLGILVGFTMIGMFSAYNKELFVRRNYHSIQSLKAENERAEKLAEDAVAALESKSRFLAVVGHELRTPLNAIIGFSELLISGVIGEVKPAKAASYISNIHESGTHLVGLVESVLDYTRTGSGMIRLTEEVIPVRTLIDHVIAGVENTLRTRHQTLEVLVPEGTPDLSIDARQVGHCLANLLSNASKFSPIGSEITCKVVAQENGSLHIIVIDSGHGFDGDNAELLFDPFAQAEDGLNRRAEGLGIGLPLTRALMQAHDGDVRISSRVGIGTVATLVFPAARTVRPGSIAEASRVSAA